MWVPAEDRDNVIIGGWVDGVEAAGGEIIVLISLRRNKRFDGVFSGEGMRDAWMM